MRPLFPPRQDAMGAAFHQQNREHPMTKIQTINKADLQQFTGSEHWYRHALNPKGTYSDGAK